MCAGVRQRPTGRRAGLPTPLRRAASYSGLGAWPSPRTIPLTPLEAPAHDTRFPAHETLWKLIKDIRFAMLTHRTSSGMLHAHPLTTQNRKVDEKGELYFFIPQSGELYERLLTDGEVNVSYADPGADSYVSLSGQARFQTTWR